MKAKKNMEDIVKSGLFGIALIVTLVLSAPCFNDEQKENIVADSDKIELKTEKDIHIPL